MKAFVLVAMVVGLWLPIPRAGAASTNIYFTQFESNESYNTALDLIGQAGWTGEGSGGNGVIPNAIQSQSAYLGFNPPLPGDDLTFVWQPINFNPLAAGFPLVKFSTQVRFVDSSVTNGNYDFFQWRVYNSQGARLFTLDFDIFLTNINYRLDGANDYTNSEVSFAFDTTYALTVTMNFAANRWSAMLDNTLITTNQPITTVNAALNLGDVDAVWFLYDPEAPGDNYMLFDNYRITAETVVVPPAQLQLLGRTGEGWTLLRVFGEDGSRWAVDATTNFMHWTALRTNPVAGGYFDFVDNSAAGMPRRFYRARFAP